MQEYHFYLEDRVKCFTTMNNHDVVTISEASNPVYVLFFSFVFVFVCVGEKPCLEF